MRSEELTQSERSESTPTLHEINRQIILILYSYTKIMEGRGERKIMVGCVQFLVEEIDKIVN